MTERRHHTPAAFEKGVDLSTALAVCDPRLVTCSAVYSGRHVRRYSRVSLPCCVYLWQNRRPRWIGGFEGWDGGLGWCWELILLSVVHCYVIYGCQSPDSFISHWSVCLLNIVRRTSMRTWLLGVPKQSCWHMYADIVPGECFRLSDESISVACPILGSGRCCNFPAHPRLSALPQGKPSGAYYTGMPGFQREVAARGVRFTCISSGFSQHGAKKPERYRIQTQTR